MLTKKTFSLRTFLWMFFVALLISGLFVGCSFSNKTIGSNGANQNKKQIETKDMTMEQIIEEKFRQSTHSNLKETKIRKELAEIMLKEKDGRRDWRCFYALYIPADFKGERDDCEVIVCDISLNSLNQPAFTIIYPKKAYFSGKEFLVKKVDVDDPALKPYYPLKGTPDQDVMKIRDGSEIKMSSGEYLVKYYKELDRKMFYNNFWRLSEKYSKAVGGYSKFEHYYDSMVDCFVYLNGSTDKNKESWVYYDLFVSSKEGKETKTKYYHGKAKLIKVSAEWKIDNIIITPCSAQDTKFTKEFIETQRMRKKIYKI